MQGRHSKSYERVLSDKMSNKTNVGMQPGQTLSGNSP
jgi:hypothetical protein